jgi:cytochrome P450
MVIHRLEREGQFMQDKTDNVVAYSQQLQMWLVSGYEEIVAVLKNHRAFSSARMYETAAEFLGLDAQARAVLGAVVPLDTPHMANVDPPDHTRLRRAAQAWFSAERLAPLAPRLRALAEELIDPLVPAGTADLVGGFTRPFPLRSILHVIGVPGTDMDRLATWYEHWARLLFTPAPPARQLDYCQSVTAMHRYFADLIAARRARPGEDLTSALVAAVDAGQARLSDAELANLLSQLLAAASDTTTYSLNSCLQHLLADRPAWQRLRSDPSFAEQVVEEGLRCNRALRGPLRVATEEVTLGGQVIARGDRLYLMHTAGNRDPRVFCRPDSFDPQRPELHRQIAFGHGIHYCLGAALARLEMKLALQSLSERLPSLRLAPGEPFSYGGTLVRALTRLTAVWDGPGELAAGADHGAIDPSR